MLSEKEGLSPAQAYLGVGKFAALLTDRLHEAAQFLYLVHTSGHAVAERTSLCFKGLIHTPNRSLSSTESRLCRLVTTCEAKSRDKGYLE